MLQTLFLLGALALAVATMLETQLLFAKIAIRRTAESYIIAGTGVATNALLRQLAGEVLANGPGAALTVAPLAPQCAGSPSACSFKISATYAVTGSTIGGTGADVATNLQTDVLAQEARSSIQMVVSVTDAQGSPLLTRSELLTVRTFAAAPYAAVVGAADASAPTSLVAEGDGAGCDPNNPTTCDPNASVVDDTQIHDQRVCQEDGNGGLCPNGNGTVPIDVDLFASPGWQNGNIAPPGWAR